VFSALPRNGRAHDNSVGHISLQACRINKTLKSELPKDDIQANGPTIAMNAGEFEGVQPDYSAYYSEMGGVGAAPEPKARTPPTGDKVVQFQRRPQREPAPSAARNSTWLRKSLPALLIFASMLALIVTYRFLTR
jgi:hypothetical protein